MQVGARGVIAPWLAGYAPTAIALLAGLALLWRAQRRGVA
jgi:lipopolysaccharide export LptBFGC system permease protein LptF